MLSFVLAAGSVAACQVPVFRFALERWEADSYRVVVLHQGELSAPQKEAVTLLKEARFINLALEVYDLDRITEAQRWLAPEATLTGGQAQVFVYYPEGAGMEEPFYACDLTTTAVRGILGSPARLAFEKAILAGASAVWMVLESGQEARDLEARETLRRLLDHAESVLEIPEGVIALSDIDEGKVDPNVDPIDMEDILRSKVPLRIGFDIHPVKRAASEEAFFRAMLSPGGDLDEPVVVAAFGRGRMMPGIPASQLNQETILGASSYLCGACSCQVKRDNPGLDFLIAADWETHLAGSLVYIEKQLPPLEGGPSADAGALQESGEERETQEAEGDRDEEEESMSPVLRNALFVGALLLACLLGGSVILLKPKSL